MGDMATPEITRTMLPVHEAGTCAVAASAEIIGAKWTALLVHDLSEGPRRFSQLEHSCHGISPRTLAERLRALEAEGIVERHSYPESPPRVEGQPGYIEDVEPYGANAAPGAGRSIYD